MPKQSLKIFETMTRLARSLDATNLGQGLPPWKTPTEIVDAAAQSLRDGPHHYGPTRGISELREAVVQHDRRYYQLDESPDNVLITMGATGALAATFAGLVQPGDGVIVIEPAFPLYGPLVSLVGARKRTLRLQAPSWDIDMESLESLVDEKTRFLLINSPMNPTGKVFRPAELQALADFCLRHDLTVICDEVYEHFSYDHPHTPLATLPGMHDRCVRINGAGKTFAVTGWRIGWITAPPHLLEPIANAHRNMVFSCPIHLQLGVAYGLSHCDDYVERNRVNMGANRDQVVSQFTQLGFDVATASGGFFLCAGFRGLDATRSDADYCEHLAKTARVVVLPLQPFCADDGDTGFVRVAFSNPPNELDSAFERLRSSLKKPAGAQQERHISPSLC